MTGFSLRPIAALVCCLFAGVTQQVIAEPGSNASHEPGADRAVAVNEAESGLRLAPRLNLLGVQPAPAQFAGQSALIQDDFPIYLSADRLNGRVDEAMIAEGSVELRKQGMRLQSDQLQYEMLDDEADALGNVRLTQEGTQIDAARLRMKLTEQTGFAEQAQYSVVKEVDSKLYADKPTVVTVASVNSANSGAPMMLNIPNIYGLPTEQPAQRQTLSSGTAERIEFAGENRMNLFGSTFTTCKASDPDWYLKSGRINLDYDEGYGDADQASLWFQGVPLFYTPKAWFPLNNQRRSGILTPSFKQSTKTGFDVTMPYYWNIAPNYDATFHPRLMSKRGFQLGLETRYLGHSSSGDWRAEYMPEDRMEGRDRYAYTIKHQQAFGRGLSGALNLNGVSDDLYWEDLSSRLLQTSQVQLPRQAVLGYAPSPWLQTSLQVLQYQTLQPDPKNPVARPYFLEPRLDLIAYRPNFLGLDFSAIAQYSRFTHDDVLNKDRGERLVFYPQLSLPIISTAFQVTPKLGLHMSSFAIDRARLTGGGSDRISRVLPTFTLDSTVVFEREGALLGLPIIQTLEPRLYYVNIPYRDQRRIPVFDTALSDFNFAQIFAENRYSGYDRINDAHQVTAAVTTRILDAETGAERFKAMIGQRYYLEKNRVVLHDFRGNPIETAPPKGGGNLIAAVNGLIAPKTYGEATWEYNTKDREHERFSVGARYQPDFGKVLSASYRYTRDPLTNQALVDQFDVAGQWPIAPQWYAVGRYNYSLRDNQMLETIGGVEYNAGCWAVRGVVQRLAAVSGTPNTSFFLQLELQDFASIGSNPLGLLRRSIPGYGKTNELPSDRSLIPNL